MNFQGVNGGTFKISISAADAFVTNTLTKQHTRVLKYILPSWTSWMEFGFFEAFTKLELFSRFYWNWIEYSAQNFETHFKKRWAPWCPEIEKISAFSDFVGISFNIPVRYDFFSEFDRKDDQFPQYLLKFNLLWTKVLLMCFRCRHA